MIIDEIRARWSGVGTWEKRFTDNFGLCLWQGDNLVLSLNTGFRCPVDPKNEERIIHAPTDINFLQAEMARMCERLKDAERVIGEASWLVCDRGCKDSVDCCYSCDALRAVGAYEKKHGKVLG